MYITKYGCVFLKLGESIYVAMDLIPILLGSLPLAHNAQHSLVITRNAHGAEEAEGLGTRLLRSTQSQFVGAHVLQRTLTLRAP